MDYSLIISIIAIIIAAISLYQTFIKNTSDRNIETHLLRNSLRENVLQSSYQVRNLLKEILNSENFKEKNEIMSELMKTSKGLEKIHNTLSEEINSNTKLNAKILIGLNSISSSMNEFNIVLSQAQINNKNKDYKILLSSSKTLRERLWNSTKDK